ncbi:MAG: hypothetical protein NUV34_01430 [Sulfuricaulis sp.]|nr:hypothetical protein [Sulfuricaulis sp.]
MKKNVSVCIRSCHKKYPPAPMRFPFRAVSALVFWLVTALSPVHASPVIGPAGHAYSYVPSDGVTWLDANAAAQNTLYSGVYGHLGTIFSQSENDFVLNNLLAGVTGSAWLGGSDAQSEGSWRWLSGEQFWQGGVTGTVGSDILYANWLSGVEPNNYNGYENYLSMFGLAAPQGIYSAPGKWNDLTYNQPGGTNSFSIQGYVVEFDLPLAVPVPAAFWLFGSGLFGLWGFARRYKR